MISLGNDVVDLNDSDSNLEQIHPKFVERVLDAREVFDIKKNRDEISKVDLWTYWAAKEASYKALKRLIPQISFHHKKFVFQPKIKKVTYEQYDIHCRIFYDSKQNPNYVHVISYVDLADPLTGVQKNISLKKKPTIKNLFHGISIYPYKKIILLFLSHYLSMIYPNP